MRVRFQKAKISRSRATSYTNRIIESWLINQLVEKRKHLMFWAWYLTFLSKYTLKTLTNIHKNRPTYKLFLNTHRHYW